MDWLKIVVASLMRQIEKLNKKKADRADVERLEQELPEGIPEGYTAHQQLVTDADGVAKWEERTHYSIPASMSLIPVMPEITMQFDEANEYMGVPGYSYTEVEYYTIEPHDSLFTVVWDGVTYSDLVVSQWPTRYWANAIGKQTPSEEVPFFIEDQHADGGILVKALTAGEHTFSVYRQEIIPEKTVKIPTKYTHRTFESPNSAIEQPLWFDNRPRTDVWEGTLSGRNYAGDYYTSDLSSVPNLVGGQDYVVTIQGREWIFTCYEVPNIFQLGSFSGGWLLGGIGFGMSGGSSEVPWCIVVEADKSSAYIQYYDWDGFEPDEGEFVKIQSVSNNSGEDLSKRMIPIPSAYLANPLPEVTTAYADMLLAVENGRWVAKHPDVIKFIVPNATRFSEIVSLGLNENGELAVKADTKVDWSKIMTESALSSYAPINAPVFMNSLSLGSRKSGSSVGAYSVAMGPGNEASSPYAIAIGYGAVASAASAIAIGKYSSAIAENSVALGIGAYAARGNQCVVGTYNKKDTDLKYLFIVGKGGADYDRSNAHTVDWNGLGWFAGGLKVGGTGQDDEAAREIAPPVIVTIRNPGADNASCDKTSIEIAEAANKGIPVIGHIVEADDSGVEQMRIANFAGLWDNGTPETIGAFFYDMRLANGFKTWGDNLSLKVLEVTPDATVSYCGGSAFAAQTT